MPRPGKLLPYAAYPAAGLIVGWASVGLTPDPPETDSVAITSPSPARETRENSPVPTPDELLDEARRALTPPGLPKGSNVTKHVASWTDDEIRAALNEAMQDVELRSSHHSIATDLQREFAKRNPELAFQWASEQAPEIRGRFADLALTGLLPERLNEAIAIAKAHPELFEGMVPNFLVKASISEATDRGPAAFISRLRELKENEPDRSFDFPGEIAAGFDFEAVLTSPDFAALDLGAMEKPMIKAWASRDRESAFRWVLEKRGTGAIMDLRKETWEAPHAETVDTIRWMVGKIEGLSAEQQAEFAKAQADHLPNDSENATVWIEAAKIPALQDSFRHAAVGDIFSDQETSVERGLKAVATLPDPEARLAMLETLDRRPSSFNGQLQPGAQKLLQTRLAEWGAAPTRVKAILEHLYGDSALIPQP
ncbi:hypothetical protein [Luteolibacter luteus]|uniref:Uncharacterized protein n=1 Tax=Luteolibacter luteus TaxID=2728835 RepID=A0A858RFH9_9BACT|nr:hypothetical protein [Luteolibacter luteus]QJE95308.1 hypothetical protein HHL09_05790 [Luteolibacter luteus]